MGNRTRAVSGLSLPRTSRGRWECRVLRCRDARGLFLHGQEPRGGGGGSSQQDRACLSHLPGLRRASKVTRADARRRLRDIKTVASRANTLHQRQHSPTMLAATRRSLPTKRTWPHSPLETTRVSWTKTTRAESPPPPPVRTTRHDSCGSCVSAAIAEREARSSSIQVKSVQWSTPCLCLLSPKNYSHCVCVSAECQCFFRLETSIRAGPSSTLAVPRKNSSSFSGEILFLACCSAESPILMQAPAVGGISESL